MNGIREKNPNDLNLDEIPSSGANVLIFGPTGSGKSSLIKSMFIALNNTFSLPPQLEKNLTVQKLTHNEGTKKYTKIEVKKGFKNV